MSSELYHLLVAISLVVIAAVLVIAAFSDGVTL